MFVLSIQLSYVVCLSNLENTFGFGLFAKASLISYRGRIANVAQALRYDLAKNSVANETLLSTLTLTPSCSTEPIVLITSSKAVGSLLST